MPAELATTLAPSEADRLLQAEALVRSYCGWHIAPSRVDEVAVLPATLGQVALLPSLHVTAVSSITEDGVTVEDTAYTWAANGVLTRPSGWYASATVTFTHGYAAVPAEVTAVVQAVAQRAVDNPGSKPREQKGPFADTFSQSGFNQAPALALLDAEKEILDAHRIPPRP